MVSALPDRAWLRGSVVRGKLAAGPSDKARSEQNQRSCVWRPARMLGRTVAKGAAAPGHPEAGGQRPMRARRRQPNAAT